MTKTISQRLQSRIARRRNFIRFVEEDRAALKAYRLEVRRFGEATGLDAGEQVTEITGKINETRAVIRDLAEDQKLDKSIGRIVLGLNQSRRFYGLSDY